MVSLDCRCERVEGVTFVELRVETDRPHRVRIENRLDGPVWPPRNRGVPAEGWDRSGFEGVVAPDAAALGYATSAKPADPAAEIATTEPAEDVPPVRPATSGHVERPGTDVSTDGSDERGAAVPGVERTPAGVVRALGDPIVPRDALPRVDGPGLDEPVNGDVAGQYRPATSVDPETGRTDDTDRPCDEGRMGGLADGDVTLVVPRQVRTWLRDVERRLDAFDDEGTTARTDAPSPLATTVAADRLALRYVARRAGALVQRAVADAEADSR